MKRIENLELIDDAWQPSEIALIKSIFWSSEKLTIDCYCQSRDAMWPDYSKEFSEVSLEFINVSNLKVEFSSLIQQVMGFDIIDVSGDGLENINFRVLDYEDGKIEFHCERIVVTKVTKSIKL
jgi:hypothetical protein